MYRALNSEAIVATCETLGKRIAERFPDSGLGRVSIELLTVARESAARIDRLRRPNWPIRGAVFFGVVVILRAAAGLILSMRVPYLNRERRKKVRFIHWACGKGTARGDLDGRIYRSEGVSVFCSKID